MKLLQSKKGNRYVFAPSDSPISEDAYWLCYRGHNLSDMMSVPVVIYSIRQRLEQNAERLLDWLNNIPKPVLEHPNIICPIDYVEEIEQTPSQIRIVKCLYIIGPIYDSVSLSGLMQGQANGTSLEFANQMYELYKNDKISFAKTVTIEILRIFERLHNFGITIGCIDPDFILFTDDNKIKINFMETFHWYLIKQATYSQRINPQSIIVSLYGAISRINEDMIAPELLYGYTDARIDLYSIGIMLFNIITGHLPHYRNGDIIVPFNQEMPLHEIKDKPLRKIIKKATEMNPTKRYQTAREFILALSNIEKVQIPWYRKIFRYFHKKKCLLCILLSTLFVWFFCPNSNAQNTMRINYKDGSVFDTPVERIDSITFIEKSEESHETTLIGEWLWGSKEKGYSRFATWLNKTYALVEPNLWFC